MCVAGCDTKDSCDCAPLYEGWGGAVEWRGEGDDDGKGIAVVDEVNESIADVVVDRDYDVGSKMACGCRVSRCRRSLVCNYEFSSSLDCSISSSGFSFTLMTHYWTGLMVHKI